MDYAKLDKELEKAIRKMDLGKGQNFSNLFEDFLDLALCPLCNNPNEFLIEPYGIEITKGRLLCGK